MPFKTHCGGDVTVDDLRRWLLQLPRPVYLVVRFFYRAGRGLTRLPFWIYRLIEYRVGKRTPALPVVGVHTVFLAKENILFLKEWILYHRLKGIDHFFLYDNTGATRSSPTVESSPHTVHGRVTKYGVPYDELVRLSSKQVQHILDEIQREIPNVEVLRWRPTDEDGNIIHAQIDAHNDALARYGAAVDWMVFMDMDEFRCVGRVHPRAVQVAGVHGATTEVSWTTGRCPPGSTT